MLNNVALIYRRGDQPKAAEPYYLRALELYEQQLGPEHADVAAVLNNLGVFYTSEGRLEEAEQMHQRALAIRRKTNPAGHSDIAQSKCNLAVVYHSRGDLTRAGELYQESLRQWESVEKPSEDYEIVASNYADLLRSLGKRRRAGAVESRARKIRARA
jgi:tetratricopeptide (TPR) repeat protein